MTFKEKVAKEEPDRINKKYVGGVRGCPSDMPFGPLSSECLIRQKSCGFTGVGKACRKCWNREMPVASEIRVCGRHNYSEDNEQVADLNVDREFLKDGLVEWAIREALSKKDVRTSITISDVGVTIDVYPKEQEDNE